MKYQKTVKTVLIVAFLILSISSATAFPGEGSGTSEDPYQVSDCDELQAVNENLTAEYELTQNIDCSDTENWNNEQGFEPIGDSDDPFEGTFNGQEYEIQNLYINRSEDEVGLFGRLGETEVARTGLTGINIKGDEYVGGLTGRMSTDTVITDTYTEGEVKGERYVGGLVGTNYDGVSGGSIADSYSAVNVDATRDSGGLVGLNRDGGIEESYASGNISITGNRGGGLTGVNRQGEISASYALGNIEGSERLGGLVGDNRGSDAEVFDTYATGDVNGSDNNIGGLVGRNTGIIHFSHAEGNVYGENHVGGLVGLSEGEEISNSYSVGDVYGQTNTGGFIGYNDDGSSISYSFATGNVEGEDRSGGFVGRTRHSISNSYAAGNVHSGGDAASFGARIGSASGGSASDSFARGSVDASGDAAGITVRGLRGSYHRVYTLGEIQGDGLEAGVSPDDTSSGLGVSDAYWSVETTNQDYGIATSSLVDEDITGLLSDELQNPDNLDGFDFAEDWSIGDENCGYPYLQDVEIAPCIQEFSVERTVDDGLNISFESYHDLESIEAWVEGPENFELTEENFTRSGDYYEMSIDDVEPGVYEAGVERIVSDDNGIRTATNARDETLCSEGSVDSHCIVDHMYETDFFETVEGGGSVTIAPNGSLENDQGRNTVTFDLEEDLNVHGEINTNVNVSAQNFDLDTTRNDAGEVGSFEVSDGDWETVEFEEEYENPVVLGTTNSQDGDPALIFQARNVEQGQAEMRLCEANSDSTGCSVHDEETAGYIVVEKSEQIPGFETGKTEIGDSVDSETKHVEFEDSFEESPVVLATTQTTEGDQPTAARITDTDREGFEVGICRQDGSDDCEDSHPEEEVGYIAFEPSRIASGEAGNITVEDNDWETVELQHDFEENPIVVSDVNSRETGSELQVPEVRSVSQNSFEIRNCNMVASNVCDSDHGEETAGWLALETGNLTIESREPVVNATAVGHRGGIPGEEGYGPGAGQVVNDFISGRGDGRVLSGASHGGIGGSSYEAESPEFYGDREYPLHFGSGGAGGQDIGGYGGGRVIVNTTDQITGNGSIITDAESLNSNVGSDADGSPGAGGSVLFESETLTGEGLISSTGGSVFAPSLSPTPGAGAGGRISIQAEQNQFTGNKSVTGGKSGEGIDGDYGTVWPSEELCENECTISDVERITGQSEKEIEGEKLEVTEEGKLKTSNKLYLDFDKITVEEGGEIKAGKNLTINTENLTVEGNVSLEEGGDGTQKVVDIESENFYLDGVLRGNTNITSNDFELAEEGIINATGMGYSGGLEGGADGLGPGGGGGRGSVRQASAGAGYGGSGGMGHGTSTNYGQLYSHSPPYGSISNPVDFGSGSGSTRSSTGVSGGGRTVVETNTTTIDGNIAVRGKDNGGAQGAGSGGAINIESEEIRGIGLLDAQGGTTKGNSGGAGAGGRIALLGELYSNLTTKVEGGKGWEDGMPATDGSTGTVKTPLSFEASSENIKSGDEVRIEGESIAEVIGQPNGHDIQVTRNEKLISPIKTWNGPIPDRQIESLRDAQSPKIFRIENEDILIHGSKEGEKLESFVWNGTEWEHNNSFVEGLGSERGGDHEFSEYTYFAAHDINNNGDLNLIVGESDPELTAWRWNPVEAQWQERDQLTDGLPNDISYARPSIGTVIGENPDMLIGDEDGEIHGYSWDDGWEENHDLTEGLTSYGGHAAPRITDVGKTGDKDLLVGNEEGELYGYTWNGAAWRSKSDLNSTLEILSDTVSMSAPAVYNYGDRERQNLLIGTESQGIFGFEWQQPFTDEDTQFNYSFTPREAGTHSLQVMSGEATKLYGHSNTVNVTKNELTVENQESNFIETGTEYIDVDETGSSTEVNLSTKVYRNLDNDIQSVWTEVEAPDGTTETVQLDNTKDPGETQTWYDTADIETLFDNQMGEYTVTYNAESELENGTEIREGGEIESRFYVQNVSMPVDLNQEVLDPDETLEINGTVINEPSGEPVEDTGIKLSFDGDSEVFEWIERPKFAEGTGDVRSGALKSFDIYDINNDGTKNLLHVRSSTVVGKEWNGTKWVEKKSITEGLQESDIEGSGASTDVSEFGGSTIAFISTSEQMHAYEWDDEGKEWNRYHKFSFHENMGQNSRGSRGGIEFFRPDDETRQGLFLGTRFGSRSFSLIEDEVWVQDSKVSEGINFPTGRGNWQGRSITVSDFTGDGKKNIISGYRGRSDDRGGFHNFRYWNGEEWVQDTDLGEGLPDVGETGENNTAPVLTNIENNDRRELISAADYETAYQWTQPVTPKSGKWSYNWTTPDVAGTYELLVNTTSDENSITGESTEEFNVTLAMDGGEAVSSESGNSHVDVDYVDQTVNLSADVGRSKDSDIDSVWATVEAPEDQKETFYLDNTRSKNESQTWYREIDVEEEFGSELGEYNITFDAETERGIRSEEAKTEFFVENVSVDTEHDERVNINEQLTITGNATREPFGTGVEAAPLEIHVDEEKQHQGEVFTWETEEDESVNDTLPEDYEPVSDWNELNDIRDNPSDNYVLINDLDKDTEGYGRYVDRYTGWEPIEDFSGTFEGNDNYIDDLEINMPNQGHIGLFGTTSGAKIKNLNVRKPEVIASDRSGVIIGESSGSTIVSNTHVKEGELEAEDDRVGLIIGESDPGEIYKSSSSGRITAEGSMVGGLVGYHRSSIINKSYSTARVDGGSRVGGLVGRFDRDAEVHNSYSLGEVEGDNAGGLAGTIRDDGNIISNSYAASSVEGSSSAGFLGDEIGDNSIEDSYWDINTSSKEEGVSSGDSTGLTGLESEEIQGSNAEDEMSLSFENEWSTTEEEFSNKNNDLVLTEIDGYPVLTNLDKFQQIREQSEALVTKWKQAKEDKTELTIRNHQDTFDQNISIIVESDITGDGEVDEVSSPVVLDGSGGPYPVALDEESENFRLRIDMETDDVTVSPELSQIELVAGAQTDENGSFSYDVQAPLDAGEYDVGVNTTDVNSVSGSETSSLGVFNTTLEIEDYPRDVFKTSGDSSDFSVTSVLTSDPDNPGTLEDVDWNYELPSDWGIFNERNLESELEPGEEVVNEFDIDIGADAELGPQVFRIDTSSEQDINASTATEGYNPDVYGDDLQAYWDFNHIENGTVKDRSGNGLDAKLRGEAELTEGVFDNSIFLKEDSDLIVPDSAEELQFEGEDFAISGWVNLTDESGRGFFRNFGRSGATSDGYNMRYGIFRLLEDNDNSFRPSCYWLIGGEDEDGSSARLETCSGSHGSIPIEYLEEWVHLTGTYKTNDTHHTAKLYRNGELWDEQIIDIEEFYPQKRNRNFTIGDEFKYVDELKVFNRSFTGDEVQDLYRPPEDQITVWTESEGEFQSGGDVESPIPRDRDNHSVYADIFDSVNDESLEDIETRFQIDEVGGSSNVLEDFNVSDEDGVAEFNWDVQDLDTGEYRVWVDPQDMPEKYINASSGLDDSTQSFEILGIFEKDDFVQSEDSIYRDPGESDSNARFFVWFEDAADGEPVEDAEVEFEFPDQNLTEYTDEEGNAEVNYEPDPEVEPGNYTVNVTADREDFDPYSFNTSLEVRGKLDTENLVDQSIVTRGLSPGFESRTVDENNETVEPSVNWSLDDQKVASGINSSEEIHENVSLGDTKLVAEADKPHYDMDTDTEEVTVYGLADITELTPPDSVILPDTEILVEAEVRDANTSEPVEDIPAKLSIDNDTVEETGTDEDGLLDFDWEPDSGIYNITAEIEGSDEEMYNVSQDFKESNIAIRQEMFIDDFNISEPEVFRTAQAPTETELEVNVSETGPTAEPIPAENRTVIFTADENEEVECTTDSEGYCSTTYEPNDVGLGDIELNAETDVEGYTDDIFENNLFVREIFLTMDIIEPGEDEVQRGEELDVELEAEDGQSNPVEPESTTEWIFQGETVATGMDSSFEVPAAADLGTYSLEVEAGGILYEEDSVSTSFEVFGRSNIELTEPENDSKVGYSETPEIRCEVEDELSSSIQDYPVEFTQNGTVIDETTTSSQGVASTNWDVPNKIDKFEIGCQIQDNETLSYNTDTEFDSKIYETEDNVPPEVENLVVDPLELDSGDEVDIQFEAFDDIEVDETWIEITRPDGVTENVPTINDSGLYMATYETSPDLDGPYEVHAKAEDTSGNVGTDVETFTTEFGGEITVEPPTFSTDNITQEQGENFSFEAEFEAIEDTDEVNLSADVTEGFVSIDPSSKECGDLEEDETCVREFNATIEDETTPQTAFITVEGEWIDPDGERSTITDVMDVSVEENPVMEVADKEFHAETTPTNMTEAADYSIESVGNFEVLEYEANLAGGNLSEEWIELENNTRRSIEPREERETHVELRTPPGTPSGYYEGTIQFSSENAEPVNRTISKEVEEFKDYTLEPLNQDATAIIENPGEEIASISITNTGNRNDTTIDVVDISGAAAAYTDLDSEEVSPQILEDDQINVITEEFPEEGSYPLEVDFNVRDPTFNNPQTALINIEALSFEIDILIDTDTQEVMPDEDSSLETEVAVGGEERVDDLEFELTFVNETFGIEEEADNLLVREEDGEFELSYRLPDLDDARTYDAVLKVTDLEQEIQVEETVEEKYEVIDITPPEIHQTAFTDSKPGENVTIDVHTTDNSMEGVKQVQLNIDKPSGNQMLENMTHAENDLWTTELNVSELGDYRTEILAEDHSGNVRDTFDYFRVSEPQSLDGELKDASGETEKANISFQHPETSREVEHYELDGFYNISVPEGNYDIEINNSGNTIIMEDTEIQSSNNPIQVTDLSSSSTPNPPDSDARLTGLAVETDLQPSSSRVKIDYSEEAGLIPSDRSIEDAELARCLDYDYSTESCGGQWELYNITTTDIDRPDNVINMAVPGFSSYTVYFPFEPDPQLEEVQEDVGGVGGEVSEELEDLLDEEEAEEQEGEVNIDTESITASLQPGETQQTTLSLENSLDQDEEFLLRPSSAVEDYMDIPREVEIEQGETEDITFSINVSSDETPSSYSGHLSVESTEDEDTIPVNIEILPADGELLDLTADPLTDTVQPGDTARIETTILNQGFERNVDVTVDFELVNTETEEIVTREEETLAVGTTLTRVLELDIPEDAELETHEIHATGEYTNIDAPRIATSTAPIEVHVPFWQRELLGVSMINLSLMALTSIFTLLIAYIGYQYKKKKELEKKRYLEKIDIGTIPRGGARQAYVGEIAEMGTRTFMKLDDITTHALIAGATGSGKTVTGQVLVEEALKEGTNVIVLDPTAQWSGYLRECNEDDMLRLYSKFGMSKSDARSFNGNIRAIEPENQEIDIKPYLETDEDQEEGEIIVFSMHKLDNENMDHFIDTTIQQVFDANLPERNQLETLIVYDEAHRILDKFGGSGKGVKQLERGAREFRKWGVGMILLSQVVADFPGEVRANVGTTVQMRTQYEEDLERVKDKFGTDTVKSIAKAEIGSGMVQNSDYNHGRPYFVDFRPMLHSPHRLSDESLEKYEQYNQKIDQLEERIDQLEQEGQEVYEYRSQLKLSKKNLRNGSFNLVDIYLDELEESLP